jgi:hypothetical protein
MTPVVVRRLFVAIVALGAAVRALAYRTEPALYPDTQFQYLEPAWRHVTGVGLQTWEWTEGLRSWVLPGMNGAWMALLVTLGVPGPWIARFVIAFWALASLAMVWGAFHAGASIERHLDRRRAPVSATDGATGGLLAAFLVAAFPLLGVYSVEPLSELASMIAFVAGLAVVSEVVDGAPHATRGRALAAGALVSFAVCVRDANAPLLLVPVVWLLVRRRFWSLLFFGVAALAPVLVFGIADAITWGAFFSSWVKHLRFNVLDHGAEGFGRAPALGHVRQIASRIPLGLPLLLLPALWGVRASWPFLGSALALVAMATSQPHKEERFVVLAYPLLLIAAGGVAGRWLRPGSGGADRPGSVRGALLGVPLRRRLRRWALRVVVALAAVAIVVDGARHSKTFDYDMPRSRFFAEAWVGAQPDATGLLIDWPFYAGGYLWFGRKVPLLKYDRDLLGNALFTHAIVYKNEGAVRELAAAGFSTAYTDGGVTVMRRTRRVVAQ